LRVIRLDKTTSTNADARRLASESDFGPLWIIADEQTAGRGRRGRSWVSPKGNFYGSFLFSTDLKPQQRGLYSFALALGVYDALKSIHGSGSFEIKWPNDVLLEGAKICGILLEAGQTFDQAWVVGGIGINLVSSPSEVNYAATHFEEHSVWQDPFDPQVILNGLSETVDHWRTILENSGFEPLREAWLSRASNVPGSVTVKLPDETFDGKAIDLGLDGALQVRLANGTIRHVHAGDVFPDV